MLQFPLWKKLVIWGLCLLGIAAAAPNLFYDRVEQHNDALVLQELILHPPTATGP